MKKTLIAYLAILSAAAMADDAGFISGTTFAGKTVDEALDIANDASVAVDSEEGAAWWYSEGEDNTAKFVGRSDAGTVPQDLPRPAKWEGVDDTNPVALSLDVQGDFVRTIKNCQGTSDAVTTWDVEQEGTIYFDSLVCFTAADQEPVVGSTDKLIVWLYADEESETWSTNLMVTAGYVHSGDQVGVTNLVLSSSVKAGQWSRLTIEASETPLSEINTTAFKIWIDGNLQTGTYVGTEDTTQSFLSLYKGDGNNETLLAGVAFKGTGAVDDLTFTTTNPYAGEVVNYFSDGTDDYATFADAIAAEATDLHLLGDYDTANEDSGLIEIENGEITLDIGTYDLTNTDEDSHAIYVYADASLTVTGSGEISSAYVEAEGTLIFGTSETSAPTVSEITVEDDAIVKYYSDTKPTAELIAGGEKDVAWSDDADEDGYYTVVFTGGSEPEGGIDPASGTIATTVTAGNETDAIAAAKTGITVPAAASEAVTAAQYAEYFTYGAVNNNDGTFTVTITGIAETVKTSVAEAAVTQLTDDEVTTVTVPAGLYYKITPSTDLPIVPITANVQNGLSTGTAITLVKPGTDAGFYQIQLSPTAIE